MPQKYEILYNINFKSYFVGKILIKYFTLVGLAHILNTVNPFWKKTPLEFSNATGILKTVLFLSLAALLLNQYYNHSAFADDSTSTNLEQNNMNKTQNKRELSLREKYENFLSLAKSFNEKENYKAAIQFYRKALNIKPNQVNIMKEIGLGYMALGEFKDALKWFEDAQKLDPKNEEIANYVDDAKWLIDAESGNVPDIFHKLPLQESTRMGVRLYYDGKYTAATAQFSESLKKIPYDIKALTVGGHALKELGRYEEAIAFYDKALALSPQSTVLLASKQDAVNQMKSNPLLTKNVDRKSPEQSIDKGNSTVTTQQSATEVAPSNQSSKSEVKNTSFTNLDENTTKTVSNQIIQQSSEIIISEKMPVQIDNIFEPKNNVIQNSNGKIKLDNSLVGSSTLDKNTELHTAKRHDSRSINKSDKTSNPNNEEKNEPLSYLKDLTVETISCLQSACFLKSKAQFEEGGSLLNYIINVKDDSKANDDEIFANNPSSDYNITSQIKNHTKLWINGKISDAELVLNFRTMTRDHLIENNEMAFNVTSSQTESNIPKWVKKVSVLWIVGKISDKEFVTMLEWLDENGFLN